ncbi:MAG TPA: DUF805 domain-containing protein [Rhodobacteraceae bacterium]|nr:DUF805 domain-containing protein [Paracoccaceae bacterium]
MDFKTAVTTCFNKYATFEGRARRSEYWWWFLFLLLSNLVLGLLDGALFGENTAILGPLFSLAVFLPSLAVGARRLHDTGRSGWWLLLGLIPLVGFLVLLFFFVQPGDEATNEYGPPPRS